MNTAVLIASDPNAGSDESLGRLRNALSLANESRLAGDTVEIGFIGAGTRWPAVASQLGHPANEAYNRVRDLVRGASRSCARANAAESSVEASGTAFVTDSATGGLSVRAYFAKGWNVAVF